MAKSWDPDEAAGVVRQIYRQVLEREPNDKAFIVYGADLWKGHRSVREVIMEIGTSREYQERFIKPLSREAALSTCYRHFLGREIDPKGRTAYIARANVWNFDNIIREMIASDEYSRTFGEDGVPRE